MRPHKAQTSERFRSRIDTRSTFRIGGAAHLTSLTIRTHHPGGPQRPRPGKWAFHTHSSLGFRRIVRRSYAICCGTGPAQLQAILQALAPAKAGAQICSAGPVSRRVKALAPLRRGTRQTARVQPFSAATARVADVGLGRWNGQRVDHRPLRASDFRFKLFAGLPLKPRPVGSACDYAGGRRGRNRLTGCACNTVHTPGEREKATAKIAGIVTVSLVIIIPELPINANLGHEVQLSDSAQEFAPIKKRKRSTDKVFCTNPQPQNTHRIATRQPWAATPPAFGSPVSFRMTSLHWEHGSGAS